MYDSISNPHPRHIDLVVLWDWEYDADFVDRLQVWCTARNLSFASYHDQQVKDFFQAVELKAFSVGLVFDRVSDVQPGIVCLLLQLKHAGTRLVNDPEMMVWCRDKATMHLELLSSGIRVPYGLILSTADHPKSLDLLELCRERLGSPFVIKPAQGGGGDGVELNALGTEDIADYFKRTGEGKIVLQHKILPQMLGRRRGWFRVFWVLGAIIPCWWDDISHVYESLDCDDETRFGLKPLYSIIGLIARISKMDLFTTEIAVDEDGQLVAVDFVNEMPDLRCQAQHVDGVPDSVLEQMALILIEHAATQARKESRTPDPTQPNTNTGDHINTPAS